MNGIFVDLVRSGEVLSPTKKGFKLEEWNSSFNNVSIKTDSDTKLYESGKIINEILGELRSKITKLYKKNKPSISNEKLLKVYFSMSNRDRAILYKRDRVGEDKLNIFSVTLSNNKCGNEVTLQEVADGCVDGLEKAISFCVQRIKNNNELPIGSDPVDVIDYVTMEANISQLYGVYEDYWQGIVWEEYELYVQDIENKIYGIRQINSEYVIASIVSQIRKSRLGAQSVMIASDCSIANFFKNDKCLSIRKAGRKKITKVVSVSSLGDEIINMNADWRVKSSFLAEEFPEELLEGRHGNGFSIIEALDVFRCLILLSYQFIDLYPKDDSFTNINELLKFCPKVDKKSLVKGLVGVTGLEYLRVSNILRFIEYSADIKQDLWCHPIIATEDGVYQFLTSSLVTPVIVRLVEHWLVKLNIEMSDKGLAYEGVVIDRLNESISSNDYINDYDAAINKRIKITSGEEEIDFLSRIGNIILVGETKSIVTTDSSISLYRTYGILKRAAEQIKRKEKFVKENLKDVFDNVGWVYSDAEEYKFVRFIINSGRTFVGYCIDGIPVCDEKILGNYFKSEIIPYFSLDDDNHLAWFVTYDNFQELQENISEYLCAPPQIHKGCEQFEYKKIFMPPCENDSYKIYIERLVPKDFELKKLLSHARVFPLKTVENIEEKLSEVKAIF